MEELLELIVPFIFVIVAALSKIKSKQSEQSRKRMDELSASAQTARELLRREQAEAQAAPRPVAPAAVSKVTEMPASQPVEEHFHEGRQDVPCPAVEREMPRIQPEKKQPKKVTVPGLNLAFDRNAVLQGFVMGEILNRPRPGVRR